MLRAKIAMAENKQLLDKIVQDIHGLYSVDPKSSEVATSFFAEHAKWSDPMFIVRGRDGIKVQFAALRLAFRQIDVTIHSANMTETGVAIDMTVNYFPRFLPDFCKIPIRQWTTLTLNSQKEVILHHDRWSVLDFLSGIKGVGFIYDTARWAVGQCVTLASRKLQSLRPAQTVQT